MKPPLAAEPQPLLKPAFSMGCGLGIVTVPLAQMGFDILALEPSREAGKRARAHCRSYPQVDIRNTTFEEWELRPHSFDAVLAGSSQRPELFAGLREVLTASCGDRLQLSYLWAFHIARKA